ncbi:acyltransferase [Rahnella bonaserana]|jgi:acetyltransferase-like isoleucine patch superfamily enzyme
MKKYIQFSEVALVECKIESSATMTSSWLELGDNLISLEIGFSTKLISANITIKSGGKLKIGNLCEIRGRIIIEEGCTLEIGNGLVCNSPIKIQVAERGRVIIGNDCLFANAQIFNSDLHSIFCDETGVRLNDARDVLIGDRVWLATNCLILKGTQIGPDCVVGAAAVVNGKYESNKIIAGNPAKVVKENITWSRSLSEKRGVRFSSDFSISEFKLAATAFNHDAVINMGSDYIHLWSEMDKSNYFVFYYLARSILIKYFYEENSHYLEINKTSVTVKFLTEVLSKCYETSGRNNFVCGSYTFLAYKMAGDTLKANELFEEIHPSWHHINEPRFIAKWTIDKQ